MVSADYVHPYLQVDINTLDGTSVLNYVLAA